MIGKINSWVIEAPEALVEPCRLPKDWFGGFRKDPQLQN